MTFRVLVLVVGVVSLAAMPARAQKRGSVEVGAFTAFMNADNSLPVGNAVGFGGRVGLNAMPWLSFEVDLAHASKDGATHSPMHVWLVYNVPSTSRSEVFAGVGYVHNKYSGSYVATDNGVGGLVGLRQRFGKMLAIRLDGHADFIPSSANKSYLISYNGNWGVGLGVSALLNR